MKQLMIGLGLLATFNAFAFPLECKIFTKKTEMEASKRSGKIKLLSDGLRDKEITIKTRSHLTKDSFLAGETSSVCDDETMTTLSDSGEFTFPTLVTFGEKSRTHAYFNAGIYIDGLWVISQFDEFERDLRDERLINDLSRKDVSFTMVEMDLTSLLEKFPVNKLEVSVAERFRLYKNNGTNVVEVLFDKNINEGDEVFVQILTECRVDGSSPKSDNCKFIVRDGVLTSKN